MTFRDPRSQHRGSGRQARQYTLERMPTHGERYRLLARMFTRPVFASLASSGDWRRALGFLFNHHLIRDGRRHIVSQLFDQAWDELRCHYRNEYVYKAELANRLIFGRHSPRTAGLHVELPVGRSIVDVAVFNGTSTAYEIKTEFDSARRIQTQTSDYLKVFDEVFVVAHPSVASDYTQLVPREVGVLSLKKGGSLSTVKPCISNREHVSSSTIFRCLRRAEYVAALEGRSSARMNYSNVLIARKCEELFCALPAHEAHRILVDALRSRQTESHQADFVSQLPRCLRALGLATPLSGRQRTTALKTLNAKIEFSIT